MKICKVPTNNFRGIKNGTSVHDFTFCSYGACAVDGGIEYLKRVGKI